jgi:hypothetical protein
MSEERSDLPATRVELMERVERAWAQLDEALIDLDPHQLSVEPSGGGWSIKDHLAHLTAWAISAVALISRGDRPAAMGIDRAVWDTDDVDQINAAIVTHWHDRAATDVLTALRTAQANLRELIGAMSDDDLAKPFSNYQPDAEPYEAAPVVGWIVGDTYGHVEEHLPEIEALRAFVN